MTFVNAQPYKSSNVIFVEFAVSDLSASIVHSCSFSLPGSSRTCEVTDTALGKRLTRPYFLSPILPDIFRNYFGEDLTKDSKRGKKKKLNEDSDFC